MPDFDISFDINLIGKYFLDIWYYGTSGSLGRPHVHRYYWFYSAPPGEKCEVIRNLYCFTKFRDFIKILGILTEYTQGCRACANSITKETVANAISSWISAYWEILRCRFELRPLAWKSLCTLLSSKTIQLEEKLFLFCSVTHSLIFESVEFRLLLWARA